MIRFNYFTTEVKKKTLATKPTYDMKKLILLLFIPLVSFGQTNVQVLEKMVEAANIYEGTESSGVLGLKAINENNSALVYQYKISDDEVANNFKNGSINYKKIVIDQSPNKLSKVAVKANIIIKWRYFYKNKIIKEVIVYPNEWND